VAAADGYWTCPNRGNRALARLRNAQDCSHSRAGRQGLSISAARGDIVERAGVSSPKAGVVRGGKGDGRHRRCPDYDDNQKRCVMMFRSYVLGVCWPFSPPRQARRRIQILAPPVVAKAGLKEDRRPPLPRRQASPVAVRSLELLADARKTRTKTTRPTCLSERPSWMDGLGSRPNTSRRYSGSGRVNIGLAVRG